MKTPKTPHIPVSPIDSSWIKAIGHDPETKTLRVELHDGAVYHYHDVEPEKHEALIGAKSIGTHLNANIKGKHDYTRINV